MSDNLWKRVADFFKELDGEDMTKSMPLYVEELRQINSNRIELIRLERERKEIRNKVIEEFASLLSNKDNIVRYDIDEILSQSGNFDYACDCFRKYIDKIAEQMKEVGE